MNRPNLKLVGGIILLAVLSLLYGGFLLLTNGGVNGIYNLNTQAAKMKAINSSVGSILDLEAYVQNRELDKFINRAALTSIAAKGVVANDWDGMSTAYNNGVIVTVSGGVIEYPEDYPEELMIDAASLTDPDGLVIQEVLQSTEADAQSDALLVQYFRIGSGVYYLEYELGSALEEKAARSFDAENRLKGIEDAFGIQVLLISTEEKENGGHTLLYKSDNLPEDLLTAEECGITSEMLGKALDSTQPVTAEKLMDFSGKVVLGGTPFQTFIQTANGSDFSLEKVYLVYLIPEDEFLSMTVEQTVVVLAAFLIVGIVLLVWFISLIRLVRHYKLSEEQAQVLGTKRTVLKAFSMIAIGCIAILIISALFLSLFRLFGVCTSVRKSIAVLEQRVEENKIQEKTTIDELKDSYVSYAQRIADILKERPELLTKEELQAFSDLIEADYIVVYDHNGKELISNSEYVNLEFGTSPESSTYEFRRLLKGIPSVVHDVKTDDETGLTNALIGVCQEYPEEPDKYGALLVAVSEDKLQPDHLETMNDVMKSIVAEGTFAFAVDPENQMIQNASDEAMIGRNAVSLNLPEAALTDSYRDFFKIDNTSCYGESKDIEGSLYYYAAEQPHIYKNILLYAGIAAGAAFIFLCVLVGYMMFGYRKEFAYWSKEGEDLDEHLSEGMAYSDDLEQGDDPRRRWKLSLSKYGINTPMHNAIATLEILVVCTIIGIGVWYFFKGANSSGSLLGFVMNGQWTKGLNLFSVISILILFAQVVIVVSILKIVVRISCSSMGPKGETFCRLALNLLTYAGMIFFVYMALFNMGINLGALVASLSLPAFALSLGAKDLITDIVAGISIVFDGEFKVGDIIDINGYRGTVLEIGVRTTKLQGVGNNIRIIANRDVKNVTNMSRKISVYKANIKISTEYRLEDVEKMLSTELPKLQNKIPLVINGPTYDGLLEMGVWFMTIIILVECNEVDYFKVRYATKHALVELFEEQGIKIRGLV